MAWMESLLGGEGGVMGLGGGGGGGDGTGEASWNRLVNWALVGFGPSGGLGGLIIIWNSCT